MGPERAVEQGGHEVLSVLGEAWGGRPAGLTLRLESDDDIPFLRDLYATTRAAELARVDWTDAQKQAFVTQQFTAQRTHYRLHYPGAAFLVIERDGIRIGRIYIQRVAAEVRLMEVTFEPACRGQGLGSALFQRLIDWSDRLGLPMTLHVEPFNPAMRLYQRLGFVSREERGFYHFMSRDVAASGAKHRAAVAG